MAAKTFYDILKGNPYHDEKGRFTTGPKASNPMIRTDPPPKNTKIAYKVFVARDGKLYPPMVANPGAMDTPVGVWLDAAEGTLATDKDGNPITNTLGRNKVKAGGKGTQGGGGTLAYRPGWHLGELPEANQFYTKDKVTGEKKNKKNFVWAECEIAADINYQEEAMSYGYNKNGKFQHSLAGLPKIPKDGYYTYRTNPDPTTQPWYITGSMKVNRILTDRETNAILRSHGIEPRKRDGGELDLKALGFTETNFVNKSNPIEKSVLFIGLKIENAEPLAIEGGENHEDFHITLAYGRFDKGERDDEEIERCVSYAVDQVKVGIPDTIRFDAIGRFPASKSSDGKDVIYAQVAAGQLEESHDFLLSLLKEKGIELEDTFPTYKPHMTLAYIDPEEDYELSEINATGTTTRVMIGYGKESSHENSFTILKADDDKRLVFGWASISFTVDGEQLEDRQEDMIDPEDLEEAAYEYVLNFRDTGEEHISTMRKKGKLVESCVLTAEKQKAMGIPEGTLPIGWWIGFKIEDDAAWEKVKNGTYRMFSIEGKANRVPVEKSVETVERVAKTFDEILKFNPYHDARGRFASANGYASFTIRTRDPKKQYMADMAIAREKERHKKEQEAKEKPITITLNQRYKEMANNWTHMRDKGAYVEREANKQLDAFRDEFKSGDYSEEQKAYLKQREKEYADLLTEKYNDQLYREGSNPSAMMAGPAKFDQRKFERKFEAEMRSQEEYRNKQQKFVENTKKQLERMESEEKQIARWRNGKWKHGESIASDDPLAEKKLQAKLDYHVEQQQKMKDANAYYRKNGSMQGFTGFNDATNKRIDAEMQNYKDRGMDYYAKQPFQSYSLTNNNASIKATRDRLTQFQNQKQRAGGTGGATKFEGGQLVRNTDINRLQIKFDSIPDAATRQKLKSSGWRWSPKEGAWQRQLTDNAESSANSILGITKSMSTPTAKGERGMSSYDYIEEVGVAKTFDEIITVAKYNPYHDSRGRFASANGGAGRAYGTTDTRDALEERDEVTRELKDNSLRAHVDKNGNLTPEREAVHKKIIDDLLEGKIPVEGQATMTMLGGGPASGKSSVMNPDTSKDPNSVTVDPDAIKKMLPGFNEMAKKDPGAAGYYHEESSALAKRFAEVAFSENYNVIYDGTGDGKTSSVQKKIDGARAKGYRVEAKYVTVDTETAVQRNRQRYEDAKARGETPRLPAEDVVRRTHASVTDISVAMASKFDHIELWDNNGGKGQQKVIASGGGEKGFTVASGQSDAVKRYLDKGNGSYVISNDGQVIPITE